MERYQHPLPDILFRAVLALATSALLLLVIFVVYIDSGVSADTDRAVPLEILGKSLQPVVGSGEVRGQQLAITAYHPGEGERTAVAVWQGRFQAAEYPLLRYQIDSAFPGPTLKLIWRTSRDPRELYSTELHSTGTGALWLNLSNHPDWQGTVEELGVYVFADAAEQALSISHLTLEPLGWRGVIASHWADWTTFRGWSSRSINYLYGTADPNALSPVLAAATWSVLAVCLLLIARLCGGGWQPGALAAVLLLPWLAVDLLWQKELTSQLTETREQFAGKTIQQKHQADVDGDIYSYITRLKSEVLPAESARIAILHQSAKHNFSRLKAQYYLLPHNVYNFGRRPPKTGVDRVDYILLLGEIPDLEFDPQTNTLVWKHGKRTLAVEQLDSDPMGSLFRVLHWHPAVEKKL